MLGGLEQGKQGASARKSDNQLHFPMSKAAEIWQKEAPKEISAEISQVAKVGFDPTTSRL